MASGAVIGSAYLEVVPKLSTNPLKKASVAAGQESGSGFDSGFGKGISGIGGTLSKALGGATKVAKVGALAAGTAIAYVSKKAFDSYASYEQLSGGIKKLFGDAASTVEANANKAYQTAGVSANEYMEQVTKFSSALTSSLGGDTAKAAEQADKAMVAMADNVNVYGSNLEDVQNAYRGFAKENYSMLDNLNLGYGQGKEEMERLIKDANEWGAANGKASDLSIDSFSDVVTAIDQIQQKQNIAGATADEAGKTIEGSINAAKGAWGNLLTELGKSDGDIEGAMKNLVTTLVGDGTDNNRGVIGNVIPRIGTIVGNLLGELPGAVATVAPQIGDALLTAFDSATGGLGSQVLSMLQPVTDALAGAFDQIGGWYEQNSGAIDTLMDSAGNFAGVISETLGGAIDFVAPIIGDLASGAIPVLTAALDFASAAIEGIANMFTNMADAISPVTDALSPVAEMLGGAFLDALKWVTDQMKQADFSEFAGHVKDALGGVCDFIGDLINDLTGFFDMVGQFLEDPIGTIQDGFASIVGSGEAMEGGVSSSFANMDANIAGSLSGVGSSIDRANGKKLKDKKATATVKGNGVDGKAESGVRNTSNAIDSLQSKTVDATVNGNAKDAGIASNIWNTVGAIKGLFDKTVNVTTNYRTTGNKVATGGIRYHAEGFIANKYGSGVLLGQRDYVGEDGAEAIVPLTNKRYTRPFADTVAEQMLRRMEGSRGPSASVVINGVSGPNEVARAVTRSLQLLEA